MVNVRCISSLDFEGLEVLKSLATGVSHIPEHFNRCQMDGALILLLIS